MSQNGYSISCAGSNPNQVYCGLNSGSFWTCGYSCPAGWHVSSSSYSISCPGSSPNEVYCNPD